MNIEEIMPFLIPLAIAEAVLLIYTLYHIFTHQHYKRGNRTLWVVLAVVGCQFWGSILYFVLGKEDA